MVPTTIHYLEMTSAEDLLPGSEGPELVDPPEPSLNRRFYCGVGGDVQIQYFGLLAEWSGCGLSGALLTAAVRQAWACPGTRRVWVHTCTDAHEHALANDQRRGFREYRRD